MNSTLSEHYGKKYASERGSNEISLICPGPCITNRFEAIASTFPKYFKGGRVLELAAGDGSVALTLLHNCPSIQAYVASDISEPRLERIRRVVPDPRLEVHSIDAQDVSALGAEQFDAVVMVALIEHLVDPLGAMQKVRQILRPGGFVYIDTPNIAKYTQRLKLLAGRFPSTASKNEGLTTFDEQPVDLHDEGHLHYFTFRSLSQMLIQRCDFRTVVPIPYPGGRTLLGTRTHSKLARWWPEMFSELALIAWV
jgi:2-polyprenyl-3-methyl-5-hydroxy-6-metoxy-1,4-benzoquinol methylase